MALNYETLGRDVRISLELIDIGGQKNHIKELLEVIATLCRDRNHNSIAAPFLWVKIEIGRKLRLSAINVCAFLINLIDSNDNLCVSCLGKLNCLCSLRFHTIIRCDNNHDDISKHRTVLANCRESLVARSIKEGNLAILIFHLISRNMLSNTTSLTFNCLFLEKRIEQSSFTVVDVTHHCHHWWAKLCIFR